MKKLNSDLLFLQIEATVETAVQYITVSDKRNELIRKLVHTASKIKQNGKACITKSKNLLDEMIHDEH